MKVKDIDYLRNTPPSEIAEELEEMRREWTDRRDELKIAQSRLIVMDKILDAIFNKAEVAVLGMDATTRTSNYPPQGVIDELTEAGYEHEAEDDPATPGQKVLRIKL